MRAIKGGKTEFLHGKREETHEKQLNIPSTLCVFSFIFDWES